MKTPFFAAALAIARKDLRAEIRSRELVSTMVVFALLSILIFSFALELDRVARTEAVSGVLWVTVVFAAILGLNRSLVMEREGGTMDAMLLAPIARDAIFTGKLIGSMAFTLLVGGLLLPLMSVLYNLPLLTINLLLVLLLGTLGFAIIGTLLAAMTAQTRARESLLPIVMLPVALPVILSSVRATNAILMPTPGNDWFAWAQILIVVDVVYLVMCFLLFQYVVED